MLALRTTAPTDLDYVLGLEADPENARFIIGWPRERHERAIADADEAHLLVVDGEAPAGFVLLAGLSGEERDIELRRIVVGPKGRGLGQRTLRLVLEHAFSELGARRVWLDVKPENLRAQAAYRRVGFTDDGELPDGLRLMSVRTAAAGPASTTTPPD
jgi:diamine N-acetyltransferase